MSSKFRFKLQQYQTDAVCAVADVFKGQEQAKGKGLVKYTRDLGSAKGRQADLFVQLENIESGAENYWDISDIGFANHPIVLDDDQLIANIKAVQQRYRVDRVSDGLSWELGSVSLDVEMELDNGKLFYQMANKKIKDGKVSVDTYYATKPDTEELELVTQTGETLGDIYSNLYAHVIDLKRRKNEFADDLRERNKRIRELEKEIEKLERKKNAESQFNKKAELNEQIRKLMQAKKEQIDGQT